MLCGVLSIHHLACIFPTIHSIPKKRFLKIVVESKSPATFTIEIADTPESRAQGLMGRMSLDEYHGMLFQYDTLSRHVMWMKNTYIPLDLLFLDDSWRIVGMIEHAQPLSIDKLSIEQGSRYVFEMAHGLIKKHQIEVGDYVKKIEGITRVIEK